MQQVNIVGPPEALKVFAEEGVLKPDKGPNFLILSTGIPGGSGSIDLGEPGEAGDDIQVEVVLRVSQGAGTLGFTRQFLSNEAFCCVSFNDTFTATLEDADGVRTIASDGVSGGCMSAKLAAICASAGWTPSSSRIVSAR